MDGSAQGAFLTSHDAVFPCSKYFERSGGNIRAYFVILLECPNVSENMLNGLNVTSSSSDAGTADPAGPNP